MLNLNVLLGPKCINKKYGYFQHIKLNSNEHSLEATGFKKNADGL